VDVPPPRSDRLTTGFCGILAPVNGSEKGTTSDPPELLGDERSRQLYLVENKSVGPFADLRKVAPSDARQSRG